MEHREHSTQRDQRDLWNKDIEARLRQAIREIRFGSVTLVIQDGHVVQIDKSEKVRLK